MNEKVESPQKSSEKALAVRIVEIYKGSDLVLKAENRSGRLISMASPPPDGFPTHPFVHAQSFSPIHEGDIREILLESENFSAFLNLLILNNYNVRGFNEPLKMERFGGFLIKKDDQTLGAIWPDRGIIFTISDPLETDQLCENFSLSIYKSDTPELLSNLVDVNKSFSENVSSFKNNGLELIEL